MGFAFPDGPDGALPQVSRTASLAVFVGLFGLWVPVFPVLEPELDPVELVAEPVSAPDGFEAVGTTAGTDVQALS